MTLVDDTPITTNSRQRRSLRAFLEKSGYGPSDILSLNYETNIFLTRGGGKYKLQNHRVIRLAGPSADPEERI